MIRTLSTIAIAGLIICAICASFTGVLIERAHSAGKFENWEGGSWFFEGEREAAGPTETRHFDWTGDDELTINVPAEVVYTQGPESGITITGPSNRLDRMTIDGGDIDIVRRNPRIRGSELKIEITAPSVRYFEFTGAQDVEIIDYDQDELRIEANGAADIDVRGRARIARITNNGAGSVDMGDLTLEDLEVEMNGAGDLTAGPTGRAEVELNGAPDVTLIHQPRSIKQEVHGVGNIRIRPAQTNSPGTAPPVTRP